MLFRGLVVVCSAVVASSALAVKPQIWTHTTDGDFAAGTPLDVAITSRGTLELAFARRELLAPRADVTSIFALAELPDGAVVATTGPQGLLLKIAPDGTTTELLRRDNDPYLLSAAVLPDGTLAIGTGGEQARVLFVSAAGEVQLAVDLPSARYAWGLAVNSTGQLFAATGPEGALFHVSSDAEPRLVFKAKQANLLSLAAGADGVVYAGTDGEGLIYRIDGAGKTFVVYDAPEADVVALAMSQAGDLLTAVSTVPPTGNATTTAGGALRGSMPMAPVPVVDAQKKSAELSIATATAAATQASESAATAPADTQPVTPAAAGGTSAAAVASEPTTAPAPRAEGSPTTPGGRATITRNALPAREKREDAASHAVYQISPAGFVTLVYKSDRPLQSLAVSGSKAWVGCGSDGAVQLLDLADNTFRQVATLPGTQVSALLRRGDGSIVAGVSNSGSLHAFASRLASSGVFTSSVLDASQPVAFGRVNADVVTPAGTTLTIATRSGNVADPLSGLWSEWSEERALPTKIASPTARFLQYRLTLQPNAEGRTPSVDEVRLAYQAQNRAPLVSELKVEPAKPDKPNEQPNEPARKLNLTWKGQDPNADDLLYTLSMRDVSTGYWVDVATELTEAKYTLDVVGLPDARYELRVTASDAQDNARGKGLTHAMTSSPITVDNTAPTLALQAARIDGRTVAIDGVANDAGSYIQAVHISVDGQASQRLPTVLAESADGLFDSPQESFTATVANLSPGPHRIAVQATDATGNLGFAVIMVTVPE